MINVAKVMEPRTSLDALKITIVLGSGVGRWAFCLSRLKTFSTLTIASSTSWPMAMARPPSVIVLMPIPNQLMTRTVATSESGMAVRLMNVVPKFQRNRNPSATMRVDMCGRSSCTLSGSCIAHMRAITATTDTTTST